MSSIPASAIVQVLPNVVSAGGSGLDIVGLILTNSARVPIGAVISFAGADDVASYFGTTSTEATLAVTYFGGYDGSTIKPAKLYFAQYASAAVAAYLRGGSLAGMTLPQLQALTGVLTVTINGTAKTSATINLSSATSFSNAATIITAGFTSPGFTVTYDAQSSAFLFTSATTGAASTITVASGSLAAPLKLTAATGAVLSQGSDVMVPAVAMAALTDTTQDWVDFTTTWEPSDSDKLAFAAWADSTNERYAYAAWTASSAAVGSTDTTSIAALVEAAGYNGTIPVYDPNNGANIAVFIMGAIASLDTGALNGRATMAFRNGNVLAGVTNRSIAANLEANGYNYVGSFATANDSFTFNYPGQISGDFRWIDSWVSQVWLNNALQLALLKLMTGVGQIPYNADGKALIETAMLDPIQAALNFGAIRAGVPLDNIQIAEINNKAGVDAGSIVAQRGWYAQVQDASAQVRAARRSPPIYLWYSDGGSVQRIVLNSLAVQ